MSKNDSRQTPKANKDGDLLLNCTHFFNIRTPGNPTSHVSNELQLMGNMYKF
jgi:hypothetical protein